MKFLIDENFHPCMKFVLEAWGHDARAVSLEDALSGLSDDAIFSLAVSEGRAIVTFNRSDYERLAHEATLAGHGHHGVITCPEVRGYKGFTNAMNWMSRLIQCAVAEFLRNRVHRLETF